MLNKCKFYSVFLNLHYGSITLPITFSLMCKLLSLISPGYSCYLFAIRHDLQNRVVDKEQEKQKILDDTKELTEKNTKISQEMDKMNQELRNVEK